MEIIFTQPNASNRHSSKTKTSEKFVIEENPSDDVIKKLLNYSKSLEVQTSEHIGKMLMQKN